LFFHQMGNGMFKKLSQLFLITNLLFGCIRYAPRPIDPPALEQSYRARSISDPNLEKFFATNSAVKEAVWPPPSLDLEGLTLLALYFSPDLDEARSRLAEAEGAIRTARTKPNPSVSGGAGYTDAEQSPYAFRFDLNVPFETAGKREYRTKRARQLSEAARFALAEVGWRVRSRLRAALIDHLISSLDLQQRNNEAQIRQETVRIYERRLEVGEVATPIVTAARTDLSRVQLEIEQIRGRIAETRAAVANAIGLSVVALQSLEFSLPGLETPPSESELNLQTVQKTGLMNRLDVQRRLAEYAAAETDMRLQIARQHPDIALGPSYSFGEGANAYTIGPGLILAIFDRNRGPIAEAESRRAAADARFTGAQATAIGEMERALADYRSALQELIQSQRTLDFVRQREQTTERQLIAGEVDRLAVVSVRLEAAAADRDRLTALRRTHSALGSLEDSVQHPLPPGNEMPQPSSTNPRETKGSLQ